MIASCQATLASHKDPEELELGFRVNLHPKLTSRSLEPQERCTLEASAAFAAG